MQIFIGEVSEQDVEMFGTDGLFENRGQYYSLMVEYGTNPGGLEDVMISDGIGRSVPVSVDHLFQLCKALVECNNINTELREADELREFATSLDTNAAICPHGHIHY